MKKLYSLTTIRGFRCLCLLKLFVRLKLPFKDPGRVKGTKTVAELKLFLQNNHLDPEAKKKAKSRKIDIFLMNLLNSSSSTP